MALMTDTEYTIPQNRVLQQRHKSQTINNNFLTHSC